MPDEIPAIFIHSGYRASSTWIWSKFRENDKYRCYNEIFNEILAEITPSSVENYSPESWRSRHPHGAPYFLEFSSLLNESRGVKGFPVENPLGSRFIGADGLASELDQESASYIDVLIADSHAQGKVPVITCTRTLGRVNALSAQYPFIHILLVRNIFQQWNSYSGQHREGNTYFLHMLFNTISLADRDKFISYMKSFFPDEHITSFEKWIGEDNYDRVFCYFAALHIYLLANAFNNVTLILDVNRLAKPDDAYRYELRDKLCKIGVHADLSGAREQIELPLYALRKPDSVRLALDSFVAKACEILEASPEQRQFASDLLRDIWSEHARFSLYSRSAVEALSYARQEVSSARESLSSVQAALDQTTAERNAALGANEAMLHKYNELSATLVAAEEEKQLLNSQLEEWRNRSASLALVLQSEHEERLQIERERHMLYSDLRLSTAPMALRAALPVARVMRPLIRFHGRVKRMARR
jgi:hypothetical protein